MRRINKTTKGTQYQLARAGIERREKKANGTRGRCPRKRGGQGDGQETPDSYVSQAITHP